MMPYTILIITESPTVRDVIDSVTGEFKPINITWLDSACFVKRLLEYDASTLLDVKPVVIVVDLALIDFNGSNLPRKNTCVISPSTIF